jgi:NosR/NirI family transcriptional regulator, nitrous oxide reductase regulator
MKKSLALAILVFLFTVQFLDSYGVQRFPKPEFESGYIQPETLLPNPRAEALALMDIGILIISLSVVSWLVVKKRSRNGVFWMSLFALAYFGFYREGCICAIGSIQNVTLAFFDHSYLIPISAILFFVAPIVYTLFFGRTFCAAVCPFGAIQDLVAFSPQKLGSRLNTVLGIIPFIYLGLAVLYAATGTDFIICRYDPFVGIWRFNASFGMYIFGGLLLVTGIFIARPYCRFLCPYGVLLNWASRISRKHITITPSNCIQCRLCENSCPYDAIDMPVTVKNPEDKRTMGRKLIFITFLIPFLMLAGGWTGSRLHEPLASVNAKVKLAKQILGPVADKNQAETFEIQAFKSAGKQQAQVFAEASEVLHKFYIGGWFLGAFIGLVFGGLITGRMITKHSTDYIPNKGTCFSCTRCVDYCPVKLP